ncbi:uncharacterized protein LOC111473517 [Cucurbita maxima]|uniref:Uncharacterized protein LOC111473517 n=1 Tax=Cucurbita maxima TaxID=3661 RepID=A0A6J1ICB6_CUCMA|nr:uncharacterized protein LOC111473517 [Cucurbita maxima]
MTNGKSIADFLSRAMAIVSQMRTYGEKISNETIVAKVLRSLIPKFDHVVATIEEAKDLSILSVDELMGSFQAHEARINRSLERNKKKALQVKETTNNENNKRENIYLAGRGRSRGREGFCSFHGGRDNRAENEEEEEKLFVAYMDTNPKKGDLWFVDSGCSNHMTGTKSLFKELDETQKIKVQLGNTKEMQVEGKDTVKVETRHGYNLLSVEQLMTRGHSVLFDDNTSVITHKKSGHKVQNVSTSNKMFRPDVSNMENFAFTASTKDDSTL